jgi:DNA-binding MarR family transcriptional regulator
MPEADQAAGGYWYTLDEDAAPTPVSVLNALRRYRSAEQEMRRRTRSAMGMGETDLIAVRYLLGAQRVGRVVTAKDLAQHLEISSASTTVLIDRLVRSGHVTRDRHPSDRRAVVVHATVGSDREVRATFGRMHDAMLDIAASLDPDELRAVRAFLERMRAAVDEAGPHEP